MQVFVTGANGFIGGAVAAAPIAAGSRYSNWPMRTMNPFTLAEATD